LVVFSTNLEPRALADEAFLRRIPYKIEVIDPTEDEFHQLFAMMGRHLGVSYRREAVEHLIAVHFKAAGRPMRFCHPRDLLLQIYNDCMYHNRAAEMTDEFLDRAVENYFAVM
jgi:hypothetical protein